MKTNTTKNKDSVLKELRNVRDKISDELKGKTTDQIVEFLKAKDTLHPKSVWQKTNKAF